MKKVQDAGFSRKRSGNAGSGPPPLPDPVGTNNDLFSVEGKTGTFASQVACYSINISK